MIVKVVLEWKEGKKVGFWYVIEWLVESEIFDVKDMGRFILLIVKGLVLELVFFYGDVEGLLFDKKVIILEIEDLDLLIDKNENLDENKCFFVILMFVLGIFCLKFGLRNLKEEIVMFFDEFWIF